MELLKLVLVDDEPIILRGLLETYDWEKMGFQVVGSALNGEEALKIIQQKKPHVVLTDIRMKKITGLMLMEQVKSLDESIMFIVISAYKDFEYAQKACEMGAFSYLVKPIEDDKLLTTMQSAFATCMEQLNSKMEHANWKKILLEDSGSFQEVVIERYLKENIKEDEIEYIFAMLNRTIGENQLFASICADVDISYKITNQADFEAQRFTLFQHLEKVFHKEYQYWTFEQDNGNRIFLIDTTNRPGISKLKDIMEQTRGLLQFEIISAISSQYSGIRALKKAYRQCTKMYEIASEAGAGALTSPKETTSEGSETGYSSQAELLVLNAVRKNDEKQLKEAYIEFVYTLPANDKEDHVKKYIHRLAVKLDFMLQDTYGLTKTIEKSFNNYYSNLENISSTKAVDIFYKLLCNVIEERSNSFALQTTKYFSDYMTVAMAYIHENLDDETLSISTVASQIYLNPVYFGRVFKNIMKVSFKQYVLNERMELAKRLIIEGRESISSICGNVGVPNPSYFTQVFKQQTGLLPSEYKKEYGL